MNPALFSFSFSLLSGQKLNHWLNGRKASYSAIYVSDIIPYFSSLSFLFCFFSSFSVFTVNDFTDLSPFCLFRQFTPVSPAVPEFLKTPTADQPPPRSTAPVLPTSTTSSAKPGPALVKVGTLHACNPQRLHLQLWCLALSTEDRVCGHIAQPAF